MDTLKDKKILITGGAGFIGSNLCEHFLNQNNKVVCLDNLSTGNKDNLKDFFNHKNFKFIDGDICDLQTCADACKGVDIIFHQAALGSVPRSIKDPIATNQVNVDGFLNMLVAARDEGVKRFIYAASSSTYGDHPGLPKQEDIIGKPLSPYAITKFVNELYADVFSKLYQMECIGLRYFNVFGKNQDPEGQYAAAIPKFILALLAGKSPTVHGDGTQTRDFTYIKNVLEANEKAAVINNPEALNQVYNVAYGSSCDINQLVKKLIDLLSTYEPSIEKIKVSYEPERKGDVKYSRADISKARKYLGYNPQYSLEQGLTEAIDWYVSKFKTEIKN